MGPFEAQVFTTLLGVSGGLVGLFIITKFLIRKKELDHADDPKVVQAVDQLRLELNDTRAEVGELHERLEFAERLLTKGREGSE